MKDGTRGLKKVQTGIVVGDKMDKTVVVSVEKVTKHPLYGKYMKRRNKYKAHDERNIAKIGDKVVIVGARPYSKEKRWRVTEVLQKAV
ncbi:MAG: 30S ribosomal protein S17 [Thermodesulfobacteriota bacterium]